MGSPGAAVAQLVARRSHNPKVVSFHMPHTYPCTSLWLSAVVTLLAAMQMEGDRCLAQPDDVERPLVGVRSANEGAAQPWSASVKNLRSLTNVPQMSTPGAAVAQLVARRSHNPKIVSSILTCRIHIPAPPCGPLLW